MKAIVYERYGGPEVLQLVDLDKPTPNRNQILIRAEACSVNPIDWRLRRGEGRFVLPFGFPRVPGYDLAGVVEQCPQHSGFCAGDRVMAFLDHLTGGAYANYAVCSTSVVAKIPNDMTAQDAAAIGLAGTTAIQCLRDFGKIGVGQRVAITGGSGGVGTFAVQIAVAKGARVTAIASGKNRELVMSLGAEKFIDYHNDNYLNSLDQCDVIFDAAGKSSFKEMRPFLCPDGRFVTTEPNLTFAALSFLTALKRGRTCRTMIARPNANDLRDLIHLWEIKKLRVIRNQTFPLAEAAAAQRHGESGNGVGKIVLTIP